MDATSTVSKQHRAHCAWSNTEHRVTTYIVSKRVVGSTLSSTKRRKWAHRTGPVWSRRSCGAYRPAAEDFRGRRHSSTCPCVCVCVCYIAALSQLGFNSAAAAAVAAWHARASLCTSFTRARRGGGSTHFHPPLRPCRQVPWTTKNTYRNSRAVCDTTPDREQVLNLVKPKVGHHAT